MCVCVDYTDIIYFTGVYYMYIVNCTDIDCSYIIYFTGIYYTGEYNFLMNDISLSAETWKSN